MEVRRAVVLASFVACVPAGRAEAQEATPSATAAFPDSAPPSGSAQAGSSRAGFPVPGRPQTTASPSNPTQYPGWRAAPGSAQPGSYSYGGATARGPYGAQPAPYGAGSYTNANGSNAYGATAYGAQNTRPYTNPYGANPYGVSPYGSAAGADRAAPSGGAHADEDAVRYASLTVSAIRLVLPVFEAMLEARPTEHVGVAVLGGIGKAPPKIIGQTVFEGTDSVSVHEIGGQLLVYPLSSFDGFVVGAEVRYTKASGTVSAEGMSTDASASAAAFGPFLGGKWIHESGFTLLAHAGVERVWLGAEFTVSGQNHTYSDSLWFPILDLNVGWSF